MRVWTKQERKQILEMHRKGIKHIFIAQEMGTSAQMVCLLKRKALLEENMIIHKALNRLKEICFRLRNKNVVSILQ